MGGHTTAAAQVAKYKVLIVDDHPIVRQGLARLIRQESDIEICEGADNVADAFEQVKALQPDLVVVDISLKGVPGIELLSRIQAYDPRIKTLVWSTFDEKMYAERVMQAGAKGYVNKREPMDTVVVAIRQVLRNEVYLSPAMTNRIVRRLSKGQSPNQDPTACLSNRELEVFRMIGRGKTMVYIAGQLGLSPKTVEAHREKIKVKLEMKSAAELNCRAVQWMLENG